MLRSTKMIARCQPGFEDLLKAELHQLGATLVENGEGWGRFVFDKVIDENKTPVCFASQILTNPVEITGESVNALSLALLEWFFDNYKNERIEAEWLCHFVAASGLDGLGRRMSGVEKAFREGLKKRMGRVARLATDQFPMGSGQRLGMFVFFVDFKRLYVAKTSWFGGQRRMADDAQAPSRSYLKVEEAYGVLGYEPKSGETVVDLGAAPGGWSYSAAKRGARVIAIDNGPLKGGALNHLLIEHRREDAFGFRPAQAEVFDWLFCDLVEEPHHVLRNLISPWLENGWCRHFVIILKFGRVDPMALLKSVTATDSIFSRYCSHFKVRHLYHDREEFSIVGEVRQ